MRPDDQAAIDPARHSFVAIARPHAASGCQNTGWSKPPARGAAPSDLLLIKSEGVRALPCPSTLNARSHDQLAQVAPIGGLGVVVRPAREPKLPMFRSAAVSWRKPTPRFSIDPEVIAAIALLSAALVVGLSTVADYGLTVDEFNTDDYGPKALAWYTSGFKDRSHFETVEVSCGSTGHGFTCSRPSPVVRACRSDYHPSCRDVRRRACRAGRAPANRTTCDRPLGWSCHPRIVPADGVFVRQLVFHAYRRSVSVRDELVDVHHRGDGTPGRAVMAGDSRGRSHDWLAIATRTGGIITHAYLFGAMILCVERILGPARPGDARYICCSPMRCAPVVVIAWVTRMAVAVAADRQSVAAIQGRSCTLCDHPDVV